MTFETSAEVRRIRDAIDHPIIDSDGHIYDPVWQRRTELGVSPTFHSAGMGWGSRMWEGRVEDFDLPT